MGDVSGLKKCLRVVPWGPSVASANRTHFRKRFLQSTGNKIEKDSPPSLRSNWKVSSIRSFLIPKDTGSFPLALSIWVMDRAMDMIRSATLVLGGGS